MNDNYRSPARPRRARESWYNVFIVSSIALALAFILYGTVYRLWNPPTPSPKWMPLPELNLKYAYLLLLMDYVFALWVAWHTPTTRLIGLAVMGAVLGFCTEATAHYAGMWVYGNVHIIGGVFIYSLSAIALFGVVYLVNLILSRLPFMKTMGWFNVILVVLVFLTLYATASSEYIELIRQNHYVEIYYWALFFFAVTIAYNMRLSILLSALIAAPLMSVSGLYAGGTHAQIWTFLPCVENGAYTFPPLFLIIVIWPMECIVEYGLSCSISDLLIYTFKARKQQRIEDGKEPLPGKGGKRISPEERLNIQFYGYEPSIDPPFPFLLRIGRRGLTKMFCKSPEKGEVIAAFAGAALLTSALLECKNEYFDSFGRFGQINLLHAGIIAAFFGFAMLVSHRMFWKRVAGFAMVGIVISYGLFAGLKLALQDVPQESPYIEELSWGFYGLFVFIVIYGAAHLVTRFLARMYASFENENRDPMSDFVQDHGKTMAGITIVSMILVLFLFILLLIRPDFLRGSNPTLFLFLSGVLLTFILWWLFPHIPAIRSVIHVIVAVVISAVALYPVLWRDFSPRWLWHFALYIDAMTLGYLFSYTASAHLAGENLVKGIRMTYWRKPEAKPSKTTRIVFHDTPHAKGLHREEIPTEPRKSSISKPGELHTYPPIHSGVNVTSAKPLDADKGNCQVSVKEAARQTLDGLVGCWPSPDGTGELVSSVRDAVKGKKVFIKPNLVVPCGSPYVTDPELVAEVALYCLDVGRAKEVVIGDIAISNISSRMSIVDTGLKDFWEYINPRIRVLVLDETQFRLVNLFDHEKNKVKGVILDRFYEPAALLEKDTFYINIPKMKTHLQSSVTLGFKNSHGLCAEVDRGLYHQRIAQKVVDITKTWMPDLTIIDGYDALEGIGPWPGDRVPLRVLVASNDVVLADLVASQLMQKEDLVPDFSIPVDFSKKLVKSTWLGYQQGLGMLDTENVTRTIGRDRQPVDPEHFNRFIEEHRHDFVRPEFRDEGLLKNIGQRYNKEPDFSKPIDDWDPNREVWIRWDPNTEFLPLDGHDPVVPYKGPLQPVAHWGPVKLIADEWRFPDLGSSVMVSGAFGLLKSVLERYFSREMDIMKGFVIVYGPLRKPLECEGVLLFGDAAISTEYMVFAPRIYQLAGHGRPPNRYSQPFDRIGEELRGEIVGFATEAINFARGWYW